MQSTLQVTLAVLGLLLSSCVVSAAPAPASSAAEPATVYFTPYKETGCRMSQNPHDSTKPTTYNITTGSGCVTPAYTFGSYVESANSLAASGPCSLTVYTQPGCKGTAKPGAITTYGQCVTDGNAAGASVRLACGP